MVAFNSSRRLPSQLSHQSAMLAQRRADDLPLTPQPPEEFGAARSSRRDAAHFAVARNGLGTITQVRIGRSRVVAATPQRRITEVRELSRHRVAVCIDVGPESARQAVSQIWQLYDNHGRLIAAMQSAPYGEHALLTNYQTREVCRVVIDKDGRAETVERWRI